MTIASPESVVDSSRVFKGNLNVHLTGGQSLFKAC